MRALVGLLALGAGIPLLAGPLPAQAPTGPRPAVESVRVDRPDWAAVLERVPRSGTLLVGVGVALPGGSGGDPQDRPGASRVAADAVVDAVEARLGPGGGEGRATVEPDHTVLTFLTHTDQVGALMSILGDVAFGAGPGEGVVEAARLRRAEVLRFELDSPIREVDVERRAVLYGVGDPRTRPPGGTLAAVEALSASDVEAARRRIFRSGEARVVVVGPVAPSETPPAVTGRPAAADSLAAPAALPTPIRVTGTTGDGPAWMASDRRVVTREVTNTWISVAFPIPAALPRVAALYVADRMHEELNVVPPDPGLFNATVTTVEMPEGEVLLVEAAVLPESAASFEARILALPSELAAERDPSFFRFHRGRFRAGRLIDQASPEAAATRMATELLTRGAILDFDAAVWELDADAAADAAAALTTPRVLVFGPDLVGGDPPRPAP